MTRYVALIVVFVIMIGIFVAGLNRDPRKLPSVLIDKPAPEYELPRVKDPMSTTGSADYEGQLVLVNIWATWCVGCRQEHEFLVELAARQEIPVYGIDWGVYGAPETYLVSADGKVLYKHIGPMYEEAWQREFVPRIAIQNEATR